MHQIIYETCGFACEIELDYQSITRPLILKREVSGCGNVWKVSRSVAYG